MTRYFLMCQHLTFFNVCRSYFDFVLGFTGDSTLPQYVAEEIMYTVVDLAVHQQRDPWEATVKAFSRNHTVLEHTSVVLVFRDRNNNVLCREIGLHHPPQAALGIHFQFCGNTECRPNPGDTRFKTQFADGRVKEKLRQFCRRCGYTSPWIKVSDVNWVHPVPGTSRVFWHDYPVTGVQLMTFGGGSIEKKMESGPPAKQERQGSESDVVKKSRN